MSPDSTNSRELRRWASIYQDEASSPGERDLALSALIAVYKSEIVGNSKIKEAGNILAELLTGIIKHVATGVAKCDTRGLRNEFIDESPTLIIGPNPESLPKICSYEPAAGRRPQGWLFMVLRNCWLDKIKRLKHEPLPGAAIINDVPAPEERDWSEETAFLRSAFPVVDLNLIAAWKPPQRIVLLCLAGLMLKVPPDPWETWVREYEKARQVSLARPFPGDSYLLWEDREDRMKPLAKLLGYPSGKIAVEWHRWRHYLKELPSLSGQ